MLRKSGGWAAITFLWLACIPTASAQDLTSTQLLEKFNRVVLAGSRVGFWDRGIWMGDVVGASTTGPCASNLILEGGTNGRITETIAWEEISLLGTKAEVGVTLHDSWRDVKLMKRGSDFKEFVELAWAISSACSH